MYLRVCALHQRALGVQVLNFVFKFLVFEVPRSLRGCELLQHAGDARGAALQLLEGPRGCGEGKPAVFAQGLCKFGENFKEGLAALAGSPCKAVGELLLLAGAAREREQPALRGARCARGKATRSERKGSAVRFKALLTANAVLRKLLQKNQPLGRATEAGSLAFDCAPDPLPAQLSAETRRLGARQRLFLTRDEHFEQKH